jgi:hypothetical protein
MGGKKDPDSSFDTCFENMPFAHMVDMMGKEGVGTLCEAFMKEARNGRKVEWGTLCEEMAQKCEHGLHGEGKSDMGESDVHHKHEEENGREECEENQWGTKSNQGGRS